MSESLNIYGQWGSQKVSVEATKVEVKETDNGQRGLFAKEEIFSGERMLYIPSTSLIGDEMIHSFGKKILENTNSIGKRSKEEVAIAMIKEMHSLLLREEDSLVKMTAQAVQYEWRGDDAVALFIMACRHILENQTMTPPQSGTDETIEQAEAIPVVHAALAVEGDDDAENQPGDPQINALEEGPESTELYPSFLPHISMLPRFFPTSPLLYSDDELARIEGTNCHGFVLRMRSQIQSDWMQVSSILRAYLAMDERKTRCSCATDSFRFWDPDADASLYQWALLNIFSRSTDFFLTVGQSQTHRRVIAPLFDMMNHDFESDVTHAMDKQGNISVFNGSSNSIPAGSEIFLNYGNFPNEKLLLVYGFVVPMNPHDSVQIYAPIRNTDPLYATKARILLECGIANVNAPHFLKRGASPMIPDSLISVLRVVGCQTEEILSVVTGNDKNIGMISARNEFSALTALEGALHTMARRIALNLISDESLLGATNLRPSFDEPRSSSDEPKQALEAAEERLGGTNMQNAKALCQSEYLILQTALSEITQRKEMLPNPNSTTIASQ